jgi:hypothetical protein
MLLWIHNPDYYETAQVSRYWTLADAAAAVTPSGYDGSKALIGTAADSFVMRAVSPEDQNNFAVGGRFRATAYPATPQIVLGVVNADLDLQCCVSLDPAGTLTAWRGPMSDALVTSAATLALNAWHRIGFAGKINGSSGTVEIHLNSTKATPNVVGSFSGDTQEEPVAGWNGIYIGLGLVLSGGHFYAVDASSGGATTLLPGLRVRYYLPSAAGLYDEWEKTGGTLPQVLDDVPPDDDVTKIDATAMHQRFSLTMAAVAEAEHVHGVQSTAQVRNHPDSGYSPSHVPLIVVEGEERLGQWQSCTVEAWRGIWGMWTRHPITGNPWTATTIAEVEFGGMVQT